MSKALLQDFPLFFLFPHSAPAMKPELKELHYPLLLTLLTRGMYLDQAIHPGNLPQKENCGWVRLG